MIIPHTLQVWDEAIADGCQPDCRMATTLVEVCTRKGDTKRALATYQLMRDAAPSSSMAPSVHAYTAAMRAAAEGGAWETALAIWSDMEACGCKPTGTALTHNVESCSFFHRSALVLGYAGACTVQLNQVLSFWLLKKSAPSTALMCTTCLNRLWAEAATVYGTDAVLQCMTERNYACMEEVCHMGCMHCFLFSFMSNSALFLPCMSNSAQSCTEAMHQCHRLSQPLLQRSCFNLSVCAGAACIAASSACAILSTFCAGQQLNVLLVQSCEPFVLNSSSTYCLCNPVNLLH